MCWYLAGLDHREIEQEFTHLLNGLLKKTMGKGSASTEVHFMENMILFRLTAVLTAPERAILEGATDGARLIKDYRSAALTAGKEYLVSKINKGFDFIAVEDIFFDINVEKDVAILVFTLR